LKKSVKSWKTNASVSFAIFACDQTSYFPTCVSDQFTQLNLVNVRTINFVHTCVQQQSAQYLVFFSIAHSCKLGKLLKSPRIQQHFGTRLW